MALTGSVVPPPPPPPAGPRQGAGGSRAWRPGRGLRSRGSTDLAAGPAASVAGCERVSGGGGSSGGEGGPYCRSLDFDPAR